ncbi:MAG: protein of unknown function DUF62 [uncultured Acidimicrobiales bacterium]|uniref:SAM-dependent chlorinase/fluorinase n=1 Tax=uncultured Acidimicrobiales bacterium TaxID=310071 RepID=A0A6J4HGV3_9ACTN|nr:MAG: protein of unknown function DUF62 [uncultured Acidimicrobiales bacterium]
MPRYDTISFLSDYGHEDEFVGVVHSVIRDIAPDARVIDLTHGIPPHDTRAGGLALARAVQYVAPGVILAVVDPGVGTSRRAVAVEVGDGAGVFLGPDNGLLAPAVAMAGGATRAVELRDPSFHLPAPGPTFAGRDVFAPVAAHLCTGVELDELGPAVDTTTLLPGVLPVSRSEGEVVVAEVLWVDRFGNAQLNVGPDELPGLRHTLTTGTVVRTATVAGTYGEVPPGGVGLVVDAYGLMSLALDRHSAAEELGLEAGAELRLAPLADEPSGSSTPLAFPTVRRET